MSADTWSIGSDISDGESESSWPMPEKILSSSFPNHAHHGGEQAVDSYLKNNGSRIQSSSLHIHSSPGSTRVRVYKDGSVRVANEEMTTVVTPKGRSKAESYSRSPRSGYSTRAGNRLSHLNLTSNSAEQDLADLENVFQTVRMEVAESPQRDSALEENDNYDNMSSDWRSALAVSSLHRAYSRLVSENRSLKTALNASEKRCAELLGMEEKMPSPPREGEEDRVALEPEERKELEILRRRRDELEKELQEMQDELEKESAEKIELMQWKSEWLSKERQSMETLRKVLDETNEEKVGLSSQLVDLKSILTQQRTALNRTKSSASKMIIRVVKRWQMDKIRKAWGSWRFLHMDKNRQNAVEAAVEQDRSRRDALVRMSLARIAKRRKLAIFSSWVYFAAVQKKQKARSAQILARVQNRSQSQALNKWVEFVDIKRSSRRILVGLIARIAFKLASKSFYTWRSFVSDSRNKDLEEEREQLQSTVSEITLKKDVLRADLQRKLHFVTTKSISKWQSSLVFFCFHAWSACTESNRDQRLKMTFSAWKLHADQSRRSRAVLQRYLSNMQHRTVRKTFNAWIQHKQKSKRDHAIVAKCVARLYQNSRAKAFEAWRSFTEDTLESKRKSKRILQMICSNTLNLRFQQWKEMVQRNKEELTILETQQEKETTILKRFAARWKNRSMAQCFETWFQFFSDRVKLRTFLSRIARNSEKGAQKFSFSVWKSFAQHHLKAELQSFVQDKDSLIKDLEARLLQVTNERDALSQKMQVEIQELSSDNFSMKENHAERVIKLWKNKRLAKVFNSFKHNTQTIKFQREVLRTFTTRWLNRRLNSCFLSWLDFVSKRKFLRSFIATVLQGTSGRRLRTGFRTWQANLHQFTKDRLSNERERVQRLSDRVQELEDDNAALSVKFESELNRLFTQRDRILNRLAHLINNTTSERIQQFVFSRWKEHWQRNSRNHRVLIRFSSRMRNQNLARAFMAWHGKYKRMKEMRSLLERPVLHLRNFKLYTAFRAWRSVLEEHQFQRARMSLLFRRKERATFYRCFSSWKMFTAEAGGKKQRARLAMAQLLPDLERKYFFYWKELTQTRSAEKAQEQTSENIMKRIVSRIRRNSLHKSFQSWYLFSAKAKLMREETTRMLKKWRSRRVSSAFDAWIDVARNSQRQRVLLRQILSRLTHRQTYTAFRKWLWFIHHSEAEMLRSAYEKISSLETEVERLVWDQNAAQTVFGDSFQRLLAHRNHIREKYADVVIHKLRNLVSLKAFQSWREWALKKKVKRLRLDKFLLRSDTVWKMQVYKTWSAFVAESKRKRITLRRVLGRLKQSLLSKGWRTWSKSAKHCHNIHSGLDTIARFLNRILQRKVSAAFRTWFSFSFEKRIESITHEKALVVYEKNAIIQSRERLRALCVAKSITNWERPLLTRMFFLWKSIKEESKSEFTKLAIAGLRWKERVLASAFRGWATHVAQFRQKRRSLRSLLNRWQMTLQAKGFQKWVDATFRKRLVEIRNNRNESIVAMCLKMYCSSVQSRCFHAWVYQKNKSQSRNRAMKSLALYAKRLKHSAILPAMNQWKLAALAQSADALRFVDRQGIVEKVRKGLLSVLCTSLSFQPALIETAAPTPNAVIGPSDSASQASARSPTSRSRVSGSRIPINQTHQQHSTGALNPLAGPVDWGVLQSVLTRSSQDLFNTQNIRVFEVCNDVIAQYDSDGQKILEHSLDGHGLTALVARSGHALGVHHASRDPRFSPDIDVAPVDSGLNSSSSRPTRSSRIYLSSKSQSTVNTAIRYAIPASNFSQKDMNSSRSRDVVLGFVCVPIFDSSDRVAGLLQATRYFDSNEEDYDFSYVELCNVVLSAVSEAVSSMLLWKRASYTLSSELEEVTCERDELRDANISLSESKKEYEEYLSSMQSKSKRVDRHRSQELKKAYDRISKLESQSKSASFVEEQVMRLIKDYDHAVEMSSPPPSPRHRMRSRPSVSSTTSHVSSIEHGLQLDRNAPFDHLDSFENQSIQSRDAVFGSPVDELRRLEQDQRELAAQLGSARSRLHDMRF